jgi:hypothetical protein
MPSLNVDINSDSNSRSRKKNQLKRAAKYAASQMMDASQMMNSEVKSKSGAVRPNYSRNNQRLDVVEDVVVELQRNVNDL